MTEDKTPMQLVELRLTDRARRFANVWSTEGQVLEQARRELIEEVTAEHAEDFIFHIIQVDDNDEHSFILQPFTEIGSDKVFVGVSEVIWEEHELTEGPFAGKTVRMPVFGDDPNDD